MEKEVGSIGALTSEEKSWAAISYLWILCLVPLLLKRESNYIRYHAKQGFGLFVVELIISIIAVVPLLGWLIGFIAWLVFIILSVMGLVSALSGKMWRMPIIGEYVAKWNF